MPAASDTHAGPALPTWSLCVATLDRIDILDRCVALAAVQTAPPKEIVIVDASADWLENKARIATTVAGRAALVYLQAPKKSLPAQRNCAITASSGEILFLIDDDALMHRDCAEQILRIYAADRDGKIAALGCSNDPRVPESDPDGDAPEAEAEVRRKQAGGGGLRRGGAESPLMRFVRREIFLMAIDRAFIGYDDPASRAPSGEAPAACFPTAMLSGWSITVRREVALKEPFDGDLLAYAPAEDCDATYRFGRHGAVFACEGARLHHYEAAAGRLKRRRATELAVLNLAFFLRKHSTSLPKHVLTYYVLGLRRVVAEFLKDSLSARFSYPQLRGATVALLRSPLVFLRGPDEVGAWYQDVQMRILQS